MSRHIFSACAVGVGAVLTSPAMEESWAASCLPIIGGHSVSEAGPVDWPNASDPVLHFDLARTELTGRRTGASEYTTSIRKTVTNLNILHRVEGSIDVAFNFKYTVNGNSATPVAQRDRVDVSVALLRPLGLFIRGAAVPSGINLNETIMDSAGKDFMRFLTPAGIAPPTRIGELRPAKHHKHEHGENVPRGHKQGVILTSLIEPVGSFTYTPPDDFGLLVVPGLGKVYFGEWWAEPYRQSCTLLRVVLSGASDFVNPQTAFSGEIVIDGEENGREVP